MSITCEVCGTVNPTGTQFCEGCGVELKAAPAAAPTGAMPTDSTPTDPIPTDPMPTGSGTVSQPDLGAPVIPPAPSIPPAPAMPAPALDSQASVPSGLEGSGDMPTPAPQSAESPADLTASDLTSGDLTASVPQTAMEQPVGEQPSVDPAALTDAPASSVSSGEMASSVAGSDSTPAPTDSTDAPVNPDLTSSADAPLADAAVSANAPAMTPAVDSTMTAPEMTADVTGTEAMGTATPAPATPADAGAPRTGEAKLGVKKFGNATGDFIPLQGERLMVGRFDASSGPVDIDLSSLPGAEHISRHHAELYREAGQWFVRDLGSTNGVFVRKGGQSAFSPRLQEPTALADGDELAFGNLMLTFHQD